jgi:hypothetical protein
MSRATGCWNPSRSSFQSSPRLEKQPAWLHCWVLGYLLSIEVLQTPIDDSLSSDTNLAVPAYSPTHLEIWCLAHAKVIKVPMVELSALPTPRHGLDTARLRPWEPNERDILLVCSRRIDVARMGHVLNTNEHVESTICSNGACKQSHPTWITTGSVAARTA